MEQKGVCIKAKLVAALKDGAYTNYVFMNIDDKSYIMCTRMPNWHGEQPQLLQEGFLEYRFVEAGDKYWDKNDSTYKMYQYTDFYFLDFVPITHVLHNGIVVKKNEMVLG